MAEESKPTTTTTTSTTTGGEEEEDMSSSSPISKPKLLSDSHLVGNPQVVIPSIKKTKLPLSHKKAIEEDEGEGLHLRGTKRLRKNCPKSLDKIHPSDDGGGGFSFLGFDTGASSPQFTPKFGSFVGGAAGRGEDSKGIESFINEGN